MSELHLGNRLKVARAEKDLSQEDLAKLAGVTRQTICSIETGQYCPSALLAFVLADKLGQGVAWLYQRTKQVQVMPRRLILIIMLISAVVAAVGSALLSLFWR